MNDLLAMQVCQSVNDLPHEILYLQLANPFPFLDHVIECVVATQSQQYVHVLGIFKYMVEGDNVFVL